MFVGVLSEYFSDSLVCPNFAYGVSEVPRLAASGAHPSLSVALPLCGCFFTGPAAPWRGSVHAIHLRVSSPLPNGSAQNLVTTQ